MQISLEGHYSYSRLIRSAVPSVVMMIVISIYSIVDGLFVSNLVGTTAFAALNVIWPALAVVGAFGLMIGTGGSALVSKTLGEKDEEGARRIFSMLVEFIFCLSVISAVPLYFGMERIAVWLGAEGDMVQQCVIYGRICALGMPAFMMQMGLQPFYMVAEKPQLGTILSLACGFTNIILDALFIAGFGWGLAGAAAASMIACCVGSIVPVCFFASQRNSSRLHFRPVKPIWKNIWNSAWNGLSEFVGNISFNVLSMCYNLQLMSYYGENGVAAYSVLLYIGYIFFAVFSGYNLTVTPLVGFNYGAGDKTELRNLLRRSLKLLLALGAIMVIVSEVLAVPASRLFVGYDSALTDLTVFAMRIYMPSVLLSGITLFSSGWFTGLGNGPVSALISFCRMFVFELGLVFLLPALFGMTGIWFATDVAEILSLFLCIILILRYRERYGY